MIADPNIAVKITFSSNNDQYKNLGMHFMCECNRQVIQNGTAINANLYIALVNQVGMQYPASIKQYKA
jgi:hypothetical protein